MIQVGISPKRKRTRTPLWLSVAAPVTVYSVYSDGGGTRGARPGAPSRRVTCGAVPKPRGAAGSLLCRCDQCRKSNVTLPISPCLTIPLCFPYTIRRNERTFAVSRLSSSIYQCYVFMERTVRDAGSCKTQQGDGPRERNRLLVGVSFQCTLFG